MNYENLLHQEEIESISSIAKEVSKERNADIEKFTEALRELLKNPMCSASEMLEKYMKIMKLKYPDNGLVKIPICS